MGSRLLSKIAAGGLSAGVFLIWWPGHLPTQGVEALVARGLAWTLTFEILLLAFGPLEDLASRRLRRHVERRQERLRSRLATVPARARAGGAVALACTAAAVPVMLLSDTGPVRQAAQRAKVVERVVVERPVVKREVVVREVPAPERATDAAAPAATPQAPAATRAPRAAKTSGSRSAAKAKRPAPAPAKTAPAKTVPSESAPEPPAPAEDDAAAQQPATG